MKTMYRSHQDSTAWIATKVRPLIGLVALRGAGDILGARYTLRNTFSYSYIMLYTFGLLTSCISRKSCSPSGPVSGLPACESRCCLQSHSVKRRSVSSAAGQHRPAGEAAGRPHERATQQDGGQ